MSGPLLRESNPTTSRLRPRSVESRLAAPGSTAHPIHRPPMARPGPKEIP